MRSVNIKYVAGVDHLRGFAATLILFYHGFQFYTHNLVHGGYGGFADAEWPKTTNPLVALVVEGYSSVSLFMVLSGFIFTYGALGKSIVYKNFFVNRLWRIFPLLIFMEVGGIAVFPKAYSFLGFSQILLFQGNFPGAPAFGAFTLMVWAIAVEFQFYLVFPFLLRFYERYGVRYLFGVWAVCVMLRILGYLLEGATRDVAYFSIIGRMDQFVFGMLAAIVFVRYRRVAEGLKYAFPLSVALVLGWMVYFNQIGGYPVPGKRWIIWPSVDGFVWAFFLVSYLPLSRYVPRLISRVIGFMGECSFSVYLLHFLVLTILIVKKQVIHFPTDAYTGALLNSTLVLLPITYALSALTYLVIEKPFLDLRRSYLQTRPASAPAAATEPEPATGLAAPATPAAQ
jgi:peptidoglycan/LPS O-acetylase OafA/YrhL